MGKTLGSVGIGNIGAEMFRLAKPFDMDFITHDPYVDPSVPESLGVRMVDMDELFRESDILAVNCPLNDETHHLGHILVPEHGFLSCLGILARAGPWIREFPTGEDVGGRSHLRQRHDRRQCPESPA